MAAKPHKAVINSEMQNQIASLQTGVEAPFLMILIKIILKMFFSSQYQIAKLNQLNAQRE